MANFCRIISVSLILMCAIPASLGRRHRGSDDESDKEHERDLRDLCSKTDNSKECWKLVKAEYDRFDEDARGVAEAAMDLALGKANEIHDMLNRLREESKSDELKEKYWSCSKNYNDAIRDIEEAKRILLKDEYHNIPVQIDDALDEIKSCHNDFDDNAFDPAHIGNRNKEIRVYADLVKVASDSLIEEKHDD